MAAAFKISEITRNRTVGWGKVKAGEKARAITTADLTDDNGNILTGDALTAAIKGFAEVQSPINPADVTLITVSDLPAEYAKDVKSAVAKLAVEWGEAEVDGKKVKWTADDVVHYLVLQSRMQDAANAFIKRHRPVSDKALERTYSALVKGMKAGGKTIDEVLGVMKATGMSYVESDVRAIYG